MEDVIRAMRCEMRFLLEAAMEGVRTKARGMLAESGALMCLRRSPQTKPRDFAELDAKRTAGPCQVGRAVTRNSGIVCGECPSGREGDLE